MPVKAWLAALAGGSITSGLVDRAVGPRAGSRSSSCRLCCCRRSPSRSAIPDRIRAWCSPRWGSFAERCGCPNGVDLSLRRIVQPQPGISCRFSVCCSLASRPPPGIPETRQRPAAWRAWRCWGFPFTFTSTRRTVPTGPAAQGSRGNTARHCAHCIGSRWHPRCLPASISTISFPLRPAMGRSSCG